MKYLIAIITLLARCAFGGSIIGGGASTFIGGVPPHYSFDDTQLLYHWTFDGPDVTWNSASLFTLTSRGISNGVLSTMAMLGGSGGSFQQSISDMQPGVAGQAFMLRQVNGQNCRVTNLNLLGVSIMTVSMWILPQYVVAWNNDKMLIEGGTTDWSAQTNAIIIDTGNGSRDLTIGIRDAVNTSLFLTKTCKNTNAFPTSNIWYHCAFVFDNTSGGGNVKLFVDSTNVTLSAGTATKTSSVGKFGNHWWSFFNRGSLTLPFQNTTIDDIRIYTNELTSAQLSEIYTNTAQSINTN